MNPASAANPESSSKPPAGAKPDAGEKSRYRATLNLPQTAFPMKANLVQNEPATLKRWEKIKLYDKVRASRAGKPKYNFHDGPPYANGSIHLGHLMNKVLKDLVVRSRTMQGFDCPYVPGWDCHGLPIEHKVMTELVESKKIDKLLTLTDDQRRIAVRRECQKHAEKYHKLHTQQMTRLLTLADYEHPYMTMKPEYEAGVLEVLADLLEHGLVYRALKPVHWSIANETALAEAELEYMDREDLSVYVDFEAADPEAVYDAFGLPPHDPDDQESAKAEPGKRPGQRPSFTIWTTTPWTLPANLAIAVNPDFEYALVFVDGNVTVMAKDLVEKVTKAAKSEDVTVLATAPGTKLVGLRYRHPFVDLAKHEGVASEAFDLRGAKRDAVFTVMGAEYVTLEDGTGLVHTAPGHGAEDFQTGQREGLPVYCPVTHNGKYDPTVPQWLRGQSIWDANQKIADRLRDSGHLFYSHKFTHSYPHDWRSKTPVIFRCTEQWFVGVERKFEASPGAPAETLRQSSLDATAKDVAFVPEWGRNRMRGMLESRPDWCISRQRAWGLGIPSFTTPDGKSIMTATITRAVAAVVRAKGSDVWFQMTPEELLAGYDETKDAELPADLRSTMSEANRKSLKKGNDILDVWFESGSSWNAVLRQRGLGYPADLYLEGSDQHRGWFQVSLLTGLGVTGQPPFKTVLTHGFMVDKDGRKLSKSSGDTVENLFEEFGVDVLRWWVSSLAYENDVKVDKEFFGSAGESYRKVRNTLRFLLSNLSDYTHNSQSLGNVKPTSINAWVLAEFDKLSKEVIEAYQAFDFRGAHLKLFDFCNDTLSSLYLAAVKDRLYCDAKDAPRRRETQATIYTLADGLCRLLAPMLCHTADEAFRALHAAKSDDVCVHLEENLPPVRVHAHEHWYKVFSARSAATMAMEKAKAELGVENPLDMGVTLPDADGALAAFDAADLADLLGVSRVKLDKAASAPTVQDLRSEARCERSWKRDGTVKQRSDGGMLSDRDAAAVGVQ
ncbi:MAG: isoleucine--tRNA ligase [Phycisphaeraceae bacterium]|nr:isoleucine--tRNA ligase [Phycisphaeraceae bacterium]